MAMAKATNSKLHSLATSTHGDKRFGSFLSHNSSLLLPEYQADLSKRLQVLPLLV